MKKTILTCSLFFLSWNQVSAKQLNSIFRKKSCSTMETIGETKFQTKYSSSDQILEVEISGNQDHLATVSITNNRGSSILFQVVENPAESLSFDLSKFEAGVYNVMYISNDEIRIKKILVN